MNCKDKNPCKKIRSTFLTVWAQDAKWEKQTQGPPPRMPQGWPGEWESEDLEVTGSPKPAPKRFSPQLEAILLTGLRISK